ncbi:sensor histidine kinase [Aquimarina algiphila]|uniref:sensor histidine kinase n=1 Tax=Aquimarina algiphila TaxID=2047982 RepID=UPI00232AF1B1|nr:histidine kinase [Aquimarina algiphila]
MLKRIFNLLLSISYVIAVFIETFVFAQKKEQETIKNKNENLQTELKLLKSQINPHFLFNSLNNIYALSVIDSNKTQQSIGYLSDMLRYVLYECERPLVPLKKEVSYIKDYIKLFSLKSSKAYAITTDFSVLDGNTWIAPMLLIPFVENAFKHSNIEKPKDSFIKIQIQSTPNYINFKIENSIPKKRINKDVIGGIGLENVKKRLAILYPENHQLDIIENNEVFKVKLNIKQTNNA